MTAEDPVRVPRGLGYTIQIHDAGRTARLPALLVELGVKPDDLIGCLRDQGLTVRLRARHPSGQDLLSRLAERIPERLRAFGRRGTGWIWVTSRGEIADAAHDLADCQQVEDRTLGCELERALRHATEPLPYTTTIGARRFVWGQRTYVMGIINVTPDSFSGDGLIERAATRDHAIGAAVEQALAMEESGADLLDIGAESTRPGSVRLSEHDELDRLIPVLAAVRGATSLPLSVDTYKAQVARAALAEGADMINDVHGTALDPSMSSIVAGSGAPVILMHNRSDASASRDRVLGGRYVGVDYADLVLDVLESLGDLLDTAIEQGIDRSRILLDPGLGFGKTVGQNLRLINQGDALRVLGQPLLLGPSRKSFVGYTLGTPPEQRVHGTMASIAVAIARGAADIVRVHDVRAAVETVALADAILGTAAPSPGAGA
jgi:dihydropteroate synthase